MKGTMKETALVGTARCTVRAAYQRRNISPMTMAPNSRFRPLCAGGDAAARRLYLGRGPGRARFASSPFHKVTAVLSAVALLAFFALAPAARPQAPPAGVLVGTTLTASLRNAAAATRDAANNVSNAARAWTRQAGSRYYRADLFQTDFNSMRLHFQALRERFDWTAYLGLQLNRPNTHNALAELDAGLNIIAELLVFLDQQYVAGTLDAATLVRTCRAFEEVIDQWQATFWRTKSRLGW